MEASFSTQAASAIQQSQVKNEVATTVAKKTLDSQKQQGDAVVALLKQSEQLSAQLAQGKLDVQV